MADHNDANPMATIDRAAHQILVVDDNPVSRYATVRLLNSVGFRTSEATTGAEALAKAGDDISAMVLDVHLPDMDGMEICRILRSDPRRVRIPLLHLTAAYVKDEDKVRSLDSGADAYLTHPVEPPVLVATVQALVRARVAEAATRRSEAKFRTLYAQAPSGICLLDRDGRFIDANPALLSMMKRELTELVGRRIDDFASPEWQPSAEELAGRAGADDWQGVIPVVDAEGRLRHVEWRVGAALEPGVTIGVATDVSEQVSLESARHELLERERAARSDAERVSRMKDDLIAVLSHELRTPLNAILGWTHVLQKSGKAEAQRGLTAIERNAKTQARLISDILDVSSINRGKLRLNLEPVDAPALLGTSLDAMQPILEEHGCTLVRDVHGPFRPVFADPARFQQIVWNLFSNAIKFSPAGGEIRVSMRDTAAGLHLSVSDDGKGIAPEFLPYLFDRFTQGDSASKRTQGGLGLGLSIVRHLAELHGGWVSASSRGTGHGATFDLVLPHSSQDDAVSSGPSGERRGITEPRDAGKTADELQGLTVLLVDDDADACDMLQLILSEHGAQVHVAHTADEALAMVGSVEPDVLVSDVGMPGKDGYELMQDLRRSESGERPLPAIALTSFTRPQDVRQALAAGFDAHCGKPLRPLDLVRTIAEQARRTGALRG